MINVYTVTTEFGDIATYVLRKRADGHTLAARRACRADKGEWVKTEERQVDKLIKQYIHVEGDAIGYQFNQWTHGSRTVRRTIRDLEKNTYGEILGKAIIEGRLCTVIHNPDAWLINRRSSGNAEWEVISYE